MFNYLYAVLTNCKSWNEDGRHQRGHFCLQPVLDAFDSISHVRHIKLKLLFALWNMFTDAVWNMKLEVLHSPCSRKMLATELTKSICACYRGQKACRAAGLKKKNNSCNDLRRKLNFTVKVSTVSLKLKFISLVIYSEVVLTEHPPAGNWILLLMVWSDILLQMKAGRQVHKFLSLY